VASLARSEVANRLSIANGRVSAKLSPVRNTPLQGRARYDLALRGALVKYEVGAQLSDQGAVLVAIVTCGTGLAFMSTAAGLAAWAPDIDCQFQEAHGVTCFLVAEATFICALVALIVAGVTSLINKRATKEPKEQLS
jgi:hypothetical protein